MSAPDIEDLAASFQLHLRAAGKAKNTLTTYGDSIRFFTSWLHATGRGTTLDHLTRANLIEWFGHLRTTGARSGTVLTRFRSLRRFCRWLMAEGELQHDPMANMEQPPPSAAPVPVFTDEDLTTLLATCRGKAFEDRRDEAILRVLLDCGVRVSECAGLQLEHVDLRKTETIYVMGKGSRPRVVPFGPKTGRALDRYLRVRRDHKYANLPAWWLGQRGGMTAKGIALRLAYRAEQAGLEGVHAHRFRHTWAHDWLSSGGQERDLMRLAGWTSDAMLAVYGRSAAEERARDAHRRMSRGDRV